LGKKKKGTEKRKPHPVGKARVVGKEVILWVS